MILDYCSGCRKHRVPGRILFRTDPDWAVQCLHDSCGHVNFVPPRREDVDEIDDLPWRDRTDQRSTWQNVDWPSMWKRYGGWAIFALGTLLLVATRASLPWLLPVSVVSLLWVYSDARRRFAAAGVDRVADLSPTYWALAAAAFWIIAIPAYLLLAPGRS